MQFKNVTFGLAFLVLTFLVVGCGSMGKDFAAENTEKIVKNETTKEDILKLFGSPNRKGVENGKDMWIYEYNKYSLGKNYSKDMVLLFDKEGRVISYNTTSNFP